ncbi:MAG: SNF2-related protein, partial [Firmicutes bacterium]|nr:SNF2-related protein [Bacillota bacterium]
QKLEQITKTLIEDEQEHNRIVAEIERTYQEKTGQKSRELPEKTEKQEIAIQKPEEKKIKPEIQFTYNFDSGGIPELLDTGDFEAHNHYFTRIQGERIILTRSFGEILCLDLLHGVKKFDYQVETVRKTLEFFRGRALLCDEVGLGKTIEAGMILKEYHLRKLAKRILILTPTSLVEQWKVEMEEKIGIKFASTSDESFSSDPVGFWKQNNLIIASISLAKSRKNFDSVIENEYDLVIIDEAHHIKNKTTQGWKLVNSLKKKFILLLTATPVQNDLMELYNLITLLSPGTLSTPALFKKEFVEKNDLKKPKNMDKLRELLHTVMIRNTRAMVDVKLPPRYASTYRTDQNQVEKAVYSKADNLARMIYSDEFSSRMISMNLLSAAGSSPGALMLSLERMKNNPGYIRFESNIEDLLQECKKVGTTGKASTLLQIIRKNSDKKIIFTKYIGTLEYLAELLKKEKIPFASFHGGLSTAERERQIDLFENEVSILLTSEVGSEGRNLQFCNTMINFDLPWNPMQIEQRIGRIHRIGQNRNVFIFNLAQKGSLEDYILSVLDQKINMFELVVGEIGMILGHLDEEKEFPDIILELWASSKGSGEIEQKFDQLGESLVNSKQEYLKTRELDMTLFAEDFEV